MPSKEHKFVVTGGFDVAESLEPCLDSVGKVYGFELPDGRTVRLAVCLEVEGEDGKFDYVTNEHEMDSLGFHGLDYDELNFTEG